MYTHLLIPTDGSELSDKAVDQGLKLATSLKAKVTFLCAQPDFPIPFGGEGMMLAPEGRDEFAKSAQETAHKILESAAKRASEAGIEAQVRTSVSDAPFELIIQTAVDEGCDLIFMASHGRRGVAGLVLGSETRKVLTHSKIPVLVCR